MGLRVVKRHGCRILLCKLLHTPCEKSICGSGWYKANIFILLQEVSLAWCSAPSGRRAFLSRMKKIGIRWL
ncbi:hypothetical protein HMPREF9080_02623 [Cardiobacterium valvarum F0432]|uniref:Uncharacterized protein n=1 Tax=Cardiobacterium valvarum F0432 TaxID=797473 RepID=G9ZIJ9_9GAMM|nr:hypothetical protein HMPREF9080_02623 [Cardiobacterium valvarum F0432]